jgi:hypothetical protein
MERIKETPKAEPSGAKARQLIEEYANELRELIKRLRKFLN